MVDSLAGAGRGVEQLLKLFEDYDLKADFYVSTGPDRDAPMLQRAAGRNIIGNERNNLIAIRDAGHDVALGVFDPVAWRNRAAKADAEWISEQWRCAIDSWQTLYESSPQSHAASGCQVHPELFSLEQQAEMLFSSDVFGQTLFFPQMLDVQSECMQIPVTLPSTQELMQRSGVTSKTLHEELFDASQKLLPHGQHWRIVAGIEDIRLVEAMIVMWRGSTREFVRLAELGENADRSGVHRHTVGWYQTSDNSYVAMQSLPVTE